MHSMPDSHTIRRLRQARGLSQVALAAQVGVSRQALSAIEADRSVPSVDVALRIAAALDATVEDLFGTATEEATMEVLPADPAATGRVGVARIGGRWVSLPLAAEGLRLSADGLALGTSRRHAVVTPVRPLGDLEQNVVLMGCASALGLVADRLNSRPGAGRFLWFPKGSTAPLSALGRGLMHVAGVHLVDPKTGEANLPFVRKARSKQPLVVVTLARWQSGLLVRSDDRNRIRSVRDLQRRGRRLAVREEGSGARRLLDQQLGAAGLALDPRRDRTLQATGHLEVARLIDMGAADAGIATRDAALAFGLCFVPLAEERYDLIVPRDLLADARIERFLDALGSRPVRHELTALGYDLGDAGRHVAEVGAA
jgi:putative molybdopterin biosynthesis protein